MWGRTSVCPLFSLSPIVIFSASWRVLRDRPQRWFCFFCSPRPSFRPTGEISLLPFLRRSNVLIEPPPQLWTEIPTCSALSSFLPRRLEVSPFRRFDDPSLPHCTARAESAPGTSIAARFALPCFPSFAED